MKPELVDADRRLHGLRIVLSGSVPDRQHWVTPHDDQILLQFVRDFAGLVFGYGGRIVHGCHPSLTPVLVQQAERFERADDREKRLVLLMSEVWANDPVALPPEVRKRYEQHAEFKVTPRGQASETDPKAIRSSLTILRRQLVTDGNVMVAVGGRNQGVAGSPGVDEEISLAAEAGLPTFVLGGMGGRTAHLPVELRSLLVANDLLSAKEREEFAQNKDATEVIGQLLHHLLQHRESLRAIARREAAPATAIRSLDGVRIWLSGSIPDGDEAVAQRIRRFVAQFARAAAGAGATIVHGSHPTIVPELLAMAEDRAREELPRALILGVSQKYWADPSRYGIEKDQWRKLASVEVVPEAPAVDPNGNKHASLKLLREFLASRSDVVVAFGGKWWPAATAHAGVPAELREALARGLPCFLLGGLGGATQGYFESGAAPLGDLRNGLDAADNNAIATETNPETLVGRVLTQISRLPLGARKEVDGQPFRVLALDGGGLRGVFTAAVLARWQQQLGDTPLIRHFDLVAGTSTGGILALGLAQGLTPKALLEFYKKRGPEIFPMSSWRRRIWHGLRSWFGTKFEGNRLQEALHAAFEQAPSGLTLGAHTLTRVLIPAYETGAEGPIVYGTQHRAGMLPQNSVVALASATAAAPTYFAPRRVRGEVADHVAIDGGVWANNPALVALAEAVGPLRIPIQRIRLLSVGTTFGTERAMRLALGLGGKLGWAASIAGLLLKAQEQGVAVQCRDLLGSAAVRVDRPSPDTALDDVRAIPSWAALGERAAQEEWTAAKAFLNGVVAPDWQ